MCTAVPIVILTTTITDAPPYKPIQCKSQYTNHHHLFVKKTFFEINLCCTWSQTFRAFVCQVLWGLVPFTLALILHDSFFSPLIIISINLRRWGVFDACVLANCLQNATHGVCVSPGKWPMETTQHGSGCGGTLPNVFGMLEYLDTDLNPAMGTFVDSFDHWIGTFMTDPNICQCLFEICVPVWMVWKPNRVPPDMQVLKTIKVTCPHDIVTDPVVFEVGQMLKWHSAWYHPGLAIGLEQFLAPWLEPLCTSSGVASTPTSMGPTASNAASSSSASSSMGAVRTGRARQCNQPYPPVGLRGAKLSVILNPELWEDLGDQAIPPTMSA
ncbi:hypothetical protein F5J12DRAFT_785312 [Pisolithus orientalis]|uniref:uncharacterized protein n=1 Tax=Pisolithus orientalis TaxID=936130 RepID=UPI002224EDF7|nr:uncharacterized protein F5J12DRAFT_785312 [Pisolithus orientalis]KAI5996899.1 hypothetical protein F5J12DRAFT_785312 [Pisolithus orientalis]